MNASQKRRSVLNTYREAIRLYDEDIHEAAYLQRCAYYADGPWRDDEYNALEQEILTIWRKFTPHPVGRYKVSHVASGYSSLETRIWTNDKEQPPRATVEQLLQEFDALIAPYVQSIMEKCEVSHAAE